MKVLHFIDEIKIGGAQTHLYTILKEMIHLYPEDEHIVVVLFEDAQFSKAFQEIGVSLYCLNLRPYFVNRSYRKIYKNIKSFIKKQNPDVVESHLTWSRFFANTAAYYTNVKCRIGFEHGDVYLNSFFFRTINFLTQIYFQKIIVCSNSLKKWVHKTHKIANSKLDVMCNCVDLKLFKKEEKKNINSVINEIDNNNFVFISVGTLGRGVNKRVDISIKAISVLKQKGYIAHLIICGDGDQKAELKDLSQGLGVADQIHFLGMRNDVNKILPHCNAFIHAAPYEPFGIVCIEAMACGIPVVIPDSGGICEIISDGHDGLIYEALNVDAYAQKMKILMSDSNLYDTLKNNIDVTIQSYDVIKYVTKLHTQYTKYE